MVVFKLLLNRGHVFVFLFVLFFQFLQRSMTVKGLSMTQYPYGIDNKPVSRPCTVAKTENFWLATHENCWLHQKFPKFGFCTNITALRPMEQFSILSARFDSPMAHQNFLLLATAHDCETGLGVSDQREE